MSFNKVSHTSTPTIAGSNGSRFVRGQGQPRANGTFDGSGSGERSQGRVSRVGGLSSQEAFSSHLSPPQNGGGSDVPGWTREPNFLGIALEESDDDSEDEDEWEEVSCTASGTVVDRPLIAAPSGFTLPTGGKRSESLTLEVIEDWQPSSLPSASHTDGPRVDLPEAPDLGLASEEDDSSEADFQLEAELEEVLAELNIPLPGPSLQQGSPTPDAANSATSAPPLKLKVIEERPPAYTSTKGKGKLAVRRSMEQLHDIAKRADPLSVSSVAEDPQTRKQKVSFREKAAELARSKGGLITQPKPLTRRDPACNPSSVPDSSLHPPARAASDSSSPLFTSRAFSQHTQILRKRQTEDIAHRFRERYGGAMEHPRQTRADLAPAPVPTQPLDASKDARPTKKRQVGNKAGGKRITKAQAHAEEVLKICRSTKSYIVDIAAVRQRLASTHPAPQDITPPTSSSTRSSYNRPGKMASGVASQGTSKTQPPVRSPLPTPHLPPRLPPAPSGSIPKGLRFTKKRRLPPEPGETVMKTVGKAALSDRGAPRPRLASTGRDDGPPMTDRPERRRVDPGRVPEGSPPRKKPRLGQP